MTANTRIKITMFTGHLAGSNTAILFKLMPDYIRNKYDIRIESHLAFEDYNDDLRNSDVFITTHGHYPYFKDKINIELWHGFPLKAMANMDVGEQGSQDDIAAYWRNVDMIMSYSSLYNTLLNACMGARIDQYRITGMPRNDMLFDRTSKQKLVTITERKSEDKKIVFYMPTFRHSTLQPGKNEGDKQWDNLFGLPTFDHAAFNTFLLDQNILLIVKLHPFEEELIRKHIDDNNQPHIFFLSNESLSSTGTDLYELLGASDMLITDYSSIYFDYLLLNKPIVFAPIDLEVYRAKRGFLLEPYEFWTPGPKVFNQRMLQQEIKQGISKPMQYSSERTQIANMVHDFQDSRSSERVWQEIDRYISSQSSKQTDHKLLSLCMITKDEEDVLERCLESIKHVVDEIIIVDTGSTDATKDIALKYTDLVFDYEWTNDFSAAKNEAIKRATSNWILVLDADEYLEPDKATSLREFLMGEPRKDDIVYSLPIINFLGRSIQNGSILESSADRLFPNHKGIFYDRPIHEQLQSNKPNVKIKQKKAFFSIYHTGYLDEVKEKKDKSKRNLSIFESYKKNTQLEAYDYFTLGNEYVISGELKKAREYYTLALKDKYRHMAWYPYCIISLIEVYVKLDKVKEAWELIETKLVLFEDFPEYSSLKGMILQYFGFDDLAESFFQTALKSSDERAANNLDPWLVSPDLGYKIPHEKLTDIYFRRHNVEKTIYHLVKTIVNDPANFKALLNLISLLSQSEQPESIFHTLEQLYTKPDPLHIALLFQAALFIGNKPLVELYEAKCEANDIPIDPEDRLQLSILRNDKQSFTALVNTLSHEDKKRNKMITPILMASFIWEDTNYIDDIQMDDEHDYADILPLAKSLIEHNENNFKSRLSEKQQLHCFNWLTRLFSLQHYEAYDRLVNKVSDPAIINRLANYFYNMNQLDLAIDYYSLMLEQHPDKLDFEGLENLAHLHFNQNIVEDGLTFLKEAIRKQPKVIRLYVSFCLNTENIEEKQQYKHMLITEFPHYEHLPFIQSL